MGRTSSRLAHKKTPVSVESEEDHSEDNEEDWTYPEKKCKERERERELMHYKYFYLCSEKVEERKQVIVSPCTFKRTESINEINRRKR